jgi:hypothetical protein
MPCGPIARLLVVKLAWKEPFKVLLPSRVMPEWNVTLPVGELPVTVAVKVSGRPGSDGVLPLVRASVVVVGGRMVTVPLPEK